MAERMDTGKQLKMHQRGSVEGGEAIDVGVAVPAFTSCLCDSMTLGKSLHSSVAQLHSCEMGPSILHVPWRDED